jgi:hypothetical protein
MTGIDQYTLLIPIINQAVDFLFDEVKNILKERRNNRSRTNINIDTISNVVTEKAELRDRIIKRDNLIGDESEELLHCIEQIKQYRLNRRMLEGQIGKHGGRITAPIYLRNQLEDAEIEIDQWSQKLKNLIEKIYSCQIHLV